MSGKDLEAKDIERKVHDLAEAMQQVKSNQADKDDVVVDMKNAKQSRLELLFDDLASVFEDIPEGNDQFENALTNGAVPRYWIDMTSFVRMGADGREYEFVKDTRVGRTILGRSNDREVIGKRITDYIAERILERERMIEGDWISAKTVFETGNEGSTASLNLAGFSGLALFLWFILGLVAGATALFAATQYGWLEKVLVLIAG